MDRFEKRAFINKFADFRKIFIYSQGKDADIPSCSSSRCSSPPASAEDLAKPSKKTQNYCAQPNKMGDEHQQMTVKGTENDREHQTQWVRRKQKLFGEFNEEIDLCLVESSSFLLFMGHKNLILIAF